MRFMISYFYQIRFFTPDMVPASTAVWDPKWFHDFKGQRHVFLDKNGVLNGIRADFLNPPPGIGSDCGRPCASQIPCQFMKDYRAHLDTLDFDDVLQMFAHLADKVSRDYSIQDPTIVLIVHEPASCLCAERPCLVSWFADHGIELKEFSR